MTQRELNRMWQSLEEKGLEAMAVDKAFDAFLEQRGCRAICLDGKKISSEAIREISRALLPFGVQLLQHPYPGDQASNTYGLIFCKKDRT